MNTKEWLDHAKTELQIPSDNQLAKRLGITRQAVSGYKGHRHMDDEICIKLEKLLQLRPGTILLDIQAEREKNPELKKVWRALRRSIAASVLAAALPFVVEGGKVFAAHQCILCKLRWRAIFPRSRPLHSPYNSKKWSISSVGISFPMSPSRTEQIPGRLAFQSHPAHHNKLDHERRSGLRDRRA